MCWFDCGTRMKVPFALRVMADFFDEEHTGKVSIKVENIKVFST